MKKIPSTPLFFLGSCPKTIGFLPDTWLEHWLKFQNGPARHSRVIVWKQLKYYQIRQFWTLGGLQGALWGRIQNRKRTMGLLTQGTFLPSFEELLRKKKKKNSNKTIKAFHAKCLNNKATRSHEISRQQVQKLTPQFVYIYIGYRFPLSLSTIVFLKKNFCFLFPELFFSGNVGNSIKCKENITAPTPPPNHPHIWHVWDKKSEQGNGGLYWI